MSLKSPPELVLTQDTTGNDDVLKSLTGSDGKVHLTKANLTNKRHLWALITQKRKDLTSKEEEVFLNADNHDDCLQDLYSAYLPSEIKMLYWHTCMLAKVETNPVSHNWGRETAGKAITKIVNEHWVKLCGEG
jgi:hypothetical protein